jgi:hypothetical protein
VSGRIKGTDITLVCNKMVPAEVETMLSFMLMTCLFYSGSLISRISETEKNHNHRKLGTWVVVTAFVFPLAIVGGSKWPERFPTYTGLGIGYQALNTAHSHFDQTAKKIPEQLQNRIAESLWLLKQAEHDLAISTI